jgi:catechol 2,3-dioxygenase-like lactoylglutathione lyase family enzyme
VKKIQAQGVHHITLIGADRQTSIDFWEGVLGMPFIFEQPNLDVPEENHLYFDPGDGRLITVFTREDRDVDPSPNPEGIGNLHHLAFSVSRATFTQVARRLDERGVDHSGEIDRGFMDSIYFRDPLGQLIELASYKFEPPPGISHGEVLLEAQHLRVAAGAYNIQDAHLADAIELLTKRTRSSLSEDREPKEAYAQVGSG